MDPLTEAQSARAELHKSTYWQKSAGTGNHLDLTDKHLGNTITALTPLPAPTPAPATSLKRLGIDKVGQYLVGLMHPDAYDLVIVSAQGVPEAKQMAAKRKLIYCNASAVRADYSEGPTYAQFSANKWLLPGGPVSGKYVVDHTIAAANEAMAQAQVAYCLANGMGGIFADDSVPQKPYGIPTPPGWRDGMVSYIHRLHELCRAANLYLLANCNAYNDATLGGQDNGAGDLAWALLLKPDGVMEEDWQETRDGAQKLRVSGTAWNQLWDEWSQMAMAVQDAGMDFVGLSYNSLYPYASLLLADKGRATFIYVPPAGTAAEPWGAWATVVGDPIDPPGMNPRRFKSVDGTKTVTVTVNHAAGTATIA
jgi:hypothetical protein